MKRIFLVSITLLTILFACSSDSETSKPPVANADFFASYYQKNILRSISQFKQDAEALQQTVTNFQASTTDANYEKITLQWLTTAKTYSKAEVYNFGLIKQRFFDETIYNFPVNTERIENNIAQEATYDATYFDAQSTVAKGLSTVEYLLYGNDFNTQIAKEALLNNSYRLNYLLGVTEDIVRQANALLNTWKNEYAQTFINANASLCKENASCLSVNQIINVLDIAKVTKIGKPAGFEKSDNTNPEGLEAFRSRNSLVLIEAMLEEVKYVYFDSDAKIETLVDHINTNKEISNKIQTTYNTLKEQITVYDNSLYNGISNNPESIRPLYTSLRDLTTLFSVDVTSTLSITTLPTDNDGD